MECNTPYLLSDFFSGFFEPFEAQNDPLFKKLFAYSAPFDSLKALPSFFEELQKSRSDFGCHISEEANISPKAHLVNRDLITIEKGATIEAFAQIEGPCYIGKNVHIGHSALVRPHTVLLEGATVGHSSEVKASIFLPYAKAAHFNYVGDSFLGQKVNLGAGAILSNMRLDRKKICIKIEGLLIPTNLNKLGAILADESQVGCNATLNPGAVIKKGAFVYPNSVISGTLLANL